MTPVDESQHQRQPADDAAAASRSSTSPAGHSTNGLSAESAEDRCLLDTSTGTLVQSDLFSVQTPGYVPKKTRWVFFGYTHLKKFTPKKPHFYFNLILVYTLYATNNAIFYFLKLLPNCLYFICH